jgi:small nuclear ribonucleoprotein (snRNP)-like protein
MGIRPEEALAGAIGKEVTVTLKDGKRLRGVLREYDEYINLLLGDVEGVGKEGGKIASLLVKGYRVSTVTLE